MAVKYKSEFGKGFEAIIKTASDMRKSLILERKSIEGDIYPILQQNFIEIFETEGESINDQFPKEKYKGLQWEALREYTLDSRLQRFQRGIWTGGTAYSITNFTSSHNANTIVEYRDNKITIDIKHDEYANITLGISEDTIQNIRNVINKRVQKVIRKELYK